MTPELIAFLKDWYHWATNGAPEGEPFCREDGLCDNTVSDLVYDELTDLFGGKTYPFGGYDEYQDRGATATQHECPKRLAWVRERLIEAGELVGDDQ